MNPDSVDKNDPNDVQLQDEDIMYDIASSVEIQKVYELKRFLDRLNNDDAIAVPHEYSQATLGAMCLFAPVLAFQASVEEEQEKLDVCRARIADGLRLGHCDGACPLAHRCHVLYTILGVDAHFN
nr:hypothetical protein [Tanacetum cinerariifolium]